MTHWIRTRPTPECWAVVPTAKTVHASIRIPSPVLMQIDPIVTTASTIAPCRGQHAEHAEGVVGKTLDNSTRRINECNYIEIAVVDNVEAFIEYAVAIGVAVPADHRINVDRAPDVTLLHVAGNALFQDLPLIGVVEVGC